MDNEERHPISASKSEGSEQRNSVPETSVVSRKRALLAGLAAAPAVLTLRSRSAFAQVTPSINASICLNPATSLHPGIQCTPEPAANPAPIGETLQPEISSQPQVAQCNTTASTNTATTGSTTSGPVKPQKPQKQKITTSPNSIDMMTKPAEEQIQPLSGFGGPKTRNVNVMAGSNTDCTNSVATAGISNTPSIPTATPRIRPPRRKWINPTWR